MAILSLAIYGSRSRGDYNSSSDVDLFAITDEDHYKMIVEGNTNLACYPISLAKQRAEDGDLFMLHICKESKEIYSGEFNLNFIREAFRYKENYQLEKSSAAELAWFLIDFKLKFRNTLLLNRRVAWCVRTIFIALTAEDRKPVFSKESLVEYSANNYVGGLISLKDSAELNKRRFNELESVLTSLGLHRPILESVCLDSYLARFLATGNTMGLKTMMSLDSDVASFGYS